MQLLILPSILLLGTTNNGAQAQNFSIFSPPFFPPSGKYPFYITLNKALNSGWGGNILMTEEILSLSLSLSGDRL